MTASIRKMRIVTYLPALEALGGVELHMLEVLRELADRGHRVCLFHERDGNLTDDFASFCENLLPGSSPLYSASPHRDLPRIAARAVAAARQRPDIVYTNNFSELPWAGSIRALTRAPVVCHLHEVKVMRRISRSLLGATVARFIATSHFIRDAWIGNGLDAERIEVVHSGFSPEVYPSGDEHDLLAARVALGLPSDQYVVLYLGRLIPQKGIDVLLRAWTALAFSADEAQLLIVGMPAVADGYVDNLRARAPSGCQWLPARRDVAQVLHAADVLVLPSTWDEPLGRVIIEAMATGRPAVASAVGGIPEILDGEFASMLFARGDATALAGRLRALQSWRRDDPGLADRCREHVSRRFTIEAAVTQLEDVFARATSAGRRGVG